MKKGKLQIVLVCLMLACSLTGCKKEDIQESKVVQSDSDKTDIGDDRMKSETAHESENEQEVNEQDLFDAFLKNQAEVHFSSYQPKKYYGYDEYMFDKDDRVTLNELLTTYGKYYMEELSYDEVHSNISYTYIDLGKKGRKQLVVESGFSQGSGAQFIIGIMNGQLEMLYVIDSTERCHGTVANEYGLIISTGSSSYGECSQDWDYLDETGKKHDIYIENANYQFGEESIYPDALLDCAAEFKAGEGFENDVVLKTYCFDEYESDFTPEEEEAYLAGMLYTVEYVTDGVTWHEDTMYEDGSIFQRIFEKAHCKLSMSEEIQTAIEKAMKEANMPKEAMTEKAMDLMPMSLKEMGTVFGADVDDGKTNLEHAMIAYDKFLKNPLSFSEMLAEQIVSPYGNFEQGLVYGFALRDFTDDGIPELVIDFGPAKYPLMSKIYIYQYNETNGLVDRMFKQKDSVMGDCDVKYQEPRMVGTSGRKLVLFNMGVGDDMSNTMIWYDFVEDIAQTEYLMNGNGDTEISDFYKPILFYDITDENIEKVVTVDYWKKNSGENAFSDYTNEDAYNYLCDTAARYSD